MAASPPPLHPAPAPDTSDAELACLAAAGNVLAFERIMRRHNRLLFRTARGILRNDDDAEDTLQEAYLRAWHALAGFRAEAKLSTWLVRIVVNEALARLRRRPRGAQILALDAVMAEAEPAMQLPPEMGPDAAAMRLELRRHIEHHIDLLPLAFRTVFLLRAIEDMSVEEVAQALDLPEATVRTRFFRARNRLRETLAQDIQLTRESAFAFAGLRCDRIVAQVLAALAGAPEADATADA